MKKKVHMFVLAVCVLMAIVTFVACESRSSAHTHTMTYYAAKAATCTEDGNVEYWVCDTCGKYYSDKNGKTKIADTTSVILPASHDYIEHEGKNATCTEDGYAAYRTCSRCDYTTYEKIPAGHDYDDNYVCKQCGYTLHETKDLNYALNSDKKSYSVIGMGTAKDTDIVIAPVYEKLPVTSIGEYAFRNCSSLISITIPDSITSIERYAFSDCSGLTSIMIPNSVTSIGEDAFIRCSSLSNLTVASGNIKYRSVGNCIIETENKTLTVGCKNSVIPSDGSVTNIGCGAFYGCSGLTSITLPNGVTGIGACAFGSCSSLMSITIPNSVTNIGISAFGDCNSLASVTIPDSVISIGDCAFYGCSSLTNITVSNSVTSIGSGTFHNTAFYNNKANWKNGVLYIGKHLIEAKDTISGTYTIDSGTLTIANSAFNNCNSVTSITIPNGVTSIGYGAFNNCRSVTSITIPNSVTSIGEYAFADCSRLTSITIPNGVTNIGEYTFYNCRGLTSVTIPNTVTTIEEGAFFGCQFLTSIRLPNNVTSIGEYAFHNCRNLTSITIPISVTSMGNEVFSYCGNLTSITFNGTKSQWNAIAKGDGWADGIEDFTVHCTNGDLAKSEAGV